MSDSHTVRTRVPGQSVMSEVVRTQKIAAPRSRTARVFGVSPLTPENRAWYRGALGEELVGEVLDHLGPEWDVLHGVPISSGVSTIDHLAVGPAGVFAISTKNHSGFEVDVSGDVLTVGGQAQAHILEVRNQAARAAALLTAAANRPVEVEAVLVIVNPQKLTIRPQPTDAVVIASAQLERWLSRRDRRMEGEAVAAISDVADRDSTWHTAPAPHADTVQLHNDFNDLRAEVNLAARRRLLWASAGFVALCLTVWAGVAFVVALMVLR
jgi:hypothetical protein